MRLEEKMDIILAELKEMKVENDRREINLMLEKSRMKVEWILRGYLAGIENKADWKLNLIDFSMKLHIKEQKIDIYLDVHHNSKKENFSFDTLYSFSISDFNTYNFYEKRFLEKLLEKLKQTNVLELSLK
jgi:hypothetical protein